MSQVIVCRVALAAMLIASAAPGQIPPPQLPPGMPPPRAPARDTSRKVGSARIRGRVVAADTGQPLRKAQVRASGSDIRESRVTSTDTDGRFEVKELHAGRYMITASKGSFVSLQYG